MTSLANVVRLILIVFFIAYEFWAFKNLKSLRIKLFPIVLAAVSGLLFLILLSFVKTSIIIAIFLVIIIELSFIASALTLLLEAYVSLIGRNRNPKRTTALIIMFFLVIIVYYFLEKAI